MKMKSIIKKNIKPFMCICCLLLTGCGAIGLAQEPTFDSAYDEVTEETPVDLYISEASAIVQSVDAEGQTISLYLNERNENRVFQYDNATVATDKFGSNMSMVQLVPGEIADIKYNSDMEKLGSIIVSSEVWSQENISKYGLNTGNLTAVLGDENYSISGNVQVFSDGNAINLEQIINQDVLTFRGKGHEIMSISVDKGHGYLDLINDEALLGGWIEIGQAVISQISPDMLLTVPEGIYTVRLTNSGIDESRDIVIERNKEAVIDLGDIVIPEPENGRVIFDIFPQTAAVYVDDTRVDTSAFAIRIPFGLHQVTAKATGYDTLSEYFNVEGETTTVHMELTEAATVSGNDTSAEELKAATVTIDTPMGVEVYQDNLYMGIAPVTYLKTAGSHTITLRQTGYITRSYQIQVADDKQDVTYSFPNLDPEYGYGYNTVSGNQTTQNSNNTVSGNTVSGNSVSGNMMAD